MADVAARSQGFRAQTVSVGSRWSHKRRSPHEAREGIVSSAGEFDRRTWFVREILVEERRLRAILRRFFPMPVDVADGIQETYARLLGLPDWQLARIRSPAAFLVRVARNVAIEWARQRRLMPREAMSELGLLELPDHGPSALEVLSRREELDLMHRAIAALPDRCRRVLVLRRLHGFRRRRSRSGSAFPRTRSKSTPRMGRDCARATA